MVGFPERTTAKNHHSTDGVSQKENISILRNINHSRNLPPSRCPSRGWERRWARRGDGYSIHRRPALAACTDTEYLHRVVELRRSHVGFRRRPEMRSRLGSVNNAVIARSLCDEAIQGPRAVDLPS